MDVQNRDFFNVKIYSKLLIVFTFHSSKVGENKDFWNCMNLFLT